MGDSIRWRALVFAAVLGWTGVPPAAAQEQRDEAPVSNPSGSGGTVTGGAASGSVKAEPREAEDEASPEQAATNADEGLHAQSRPVPTEPRKPVSARDRLDQATRRDEPPAAPTDTAPREPDLSEPSGADDAQTDHERVVGHVGIGYLSATVVPTGADEMGEPMTTSAQVIGARYWLARSIGMDLGLGVGIRREKREETGFYGDVTLDTHQRAIALHFGIPIAPVFGPHYTILIVPEANIGFGRSFDDTPDAPHVENKGFSGEFGLRLGAEIQFGFVGIPKLSLQASVGAYVNRAKIRRKEEFEDPYNVDQTSFQTSLRGKVVDVFASSFALIYYF